MSIKEVSLMSLGDIHPIQPIVQLWPYEAFPDRIVFDGSSWDRVEPWTQLEGWKNPYLLTGYREDTPVPEQSRHMHVFRRNGIAFLSVNHRETNPKYDLWGHAKEVAKEHPIATGAAVAVAVPVGAIVLGKIIKAIGKFLDEQ